MGLLFHCCLFPLLFFEPERLGIQVTDWWSDRVGFSQLRFVRVWMSKYNLSSGSSHWCGLYLCLWGLSVLPSCICCSVPMESVLPTGVVGTCGYKVCLLMLERVLQETAALLPISVGGACASRDSSSKWQRLCLCL